MTYWSVPRAFPGGTVVVLASGPSMSAKVADSVKGLPTIAVKRTGRLAPWAWMLYGADWRFWQTDTDAQRFPGLKVAIETKLRSAPDILRLRNTGIDGFDQDPSCLRTGNNSGYQAVHIAIHTGAARILLAGFDMRGGHWHGNDAGPLRRDWIGRFHALSGHGAEIINCTPDSALTCFPFMSLREALIEYGHTDSRTSRATEAFA